MGVLTCKAHITSRFITSQSITSNDGQAFTPVPQLFCCLRARDDALAVDALRIFNDRNIDDLIVVNANKEPVGLVDSQDLPKLKLM